MARDHSEVYETVDMATEGPLVYASDPSAIRLYEAVGFMEHPQRLHFWSAYLPRES